MRSCCRRIPGRLLPSSACFLFRRHAQPSMAWGQRRLHRPPRSAGLLPIPLLPPRLALCQPSLCFPRLSSKRYHDCSHPFPLANSLQAHFWIGKDWGSPLSRGGMIIIISSLLCVASGACRGRPAPDRASQDAQLSARPAQDLPEQADLVSRLRISKRGQAQDDLDPRCEAMAATGPAETRASVASAARDPAEPTVS